MKTNIINNQLYNTQKNCYTNHTHHLYKQMPVSFYGKTNNIYTSTRTIGNQRLNFSGIKPNKIDIEMIIKDLYSQTYLFENPKFYEFFETNKEAMIAKLKSLYDIRGWVDIKERQIIPEFIQKVSSKHLVLLCDPGIMSRIKDFYNFVKKLTIDINSISSIDLRNMFSKSLGVQKYYRGMILTPAQLTGIKKNGITYNNFNADAAKEVLHNLLCETESSGSSYKMLMWDKANGYTQGNPLISVTQIREVAKKVPTWYTKVSPDKKNYIFELEIPPINVIEPTGEFHITYPGVGFYDKNNKKIPIEKVENFVPFIIKSDYIRSISVN